MRMHPIVLAILILLVALCPTPRAASASTAPTTPTFVLKWGAPARPRVSSTPWGHHRRRARQRLRR